MAVTAETFVELIKDVGQAREADEAALAEAEHTAATLRQRVADLRQEEQTFRAAFARRFPELAARIDEPTIEKQPEEAQDAQPSLVDMPRAAAVEVAVANLNRIMPTVSPGDIERFLTERGRRDDRDEIGSATAYLNKLRKIHSRGRGRWVYGPPPETPEGDAATSPSGPIPTEWAGGDDLAAPQAATQDHGGDPERDARDLDWQNPAVVDF